MKKWMTLALALALVLCAATAGAVTLKLSEVHAEGYPTTLADQEFARLVEERTDGRIKIDVYSGGALYGEETGAIEALQLGIQLCAGDERHSDAVSVQERRSHVGGS